MKNLLFLLILLTSCNTLRIDTRRVAITDSRNPEILMKYCATRFPVKEKDSTVIKILPGKVDTVSGPVITVDCDSAIKWKQKLVKVPCPPSTHSTDTFFKDRISVQENTAALELQKSLTAKAQEELSSTTQKLLKKTKQANTYGFILAGLLFLLVLSFILKIYLKWPKLS